MFISLDYDLQYMFQETGRLLGVNGTLDNKAFLIDNSFCVLPKGGTGDSLIIHLAKGKVSASSEFNSYANNFTPDLRITQVNIVWGMINMIVNATHQWTELTPYTGPEVRARLSRDASNELVPHNCSLEITDRSMRVRVNNNAYTYENFIRHLATRV